MRYVPTPNARGASASAPSCASIRNRSRSADRHQVQPRGGDRHAEGQGAEKFKELAEKYTNGKVKVEVYPNSQLYKDKEELEALQLGAVQMLAPSLQVRPARRQGVRGVRSALHPPRQDAAEGHRRPARQEAAQAARTKGMTGLAYWDNGFKEMSANKPLRHAGRLQGLKMRIQSSKVLEAQMRALGAIPQVMAFSRSTRRCRPAWSTAPRTPLEHLHPEDARGAEVHDHVPTTAISATVMVNKKFWDGLPAEPCRRAFSFQRCRHPVAAWRLKQRAGCQNAWTWPLMVYFSYSLSSGTGIRFWSAVGLPESSGTVEAAAIPSVPPASLSRTAAIATTAATMPAATSPIAIFLASRLITGRLLKVIRMIVLLCIGK
jgi:hypothetical protein